MAHHYFVIVDKRDSDKFRKFTLGKFNDAINKILKDNDCDFIWSFHQGTINNSIWKKIKKNDNMFFTIPKNNFEISGQVSKKIIDKKIGELMWPDDLDAKKITHFLLFKRLEKSNVLYSDLINSSTSKIIVPIPGIYEIKREAYGIITSLKTKFPKTTSNLLPKPFIQQSPKIGLPQKNKSEVNRFIRDSSLVQKLKKLYENRCQICGYTFEYQKNKFYSEVHHYNPLEENGNDDIDNMIVVCPNHHSEFDYKVIAINIDGKSIIDKNGKKINEINFHDGHKLSKRNIQSQLKIN